MPATADREKLVVGMGLGDALEMVTRHRIDFKIGYFDWGTTREVAVAQWFVIQRRDIDDALILCAESEHGETMRVRSLFWWRDYQRDVKLPKGKRKSKTTDVESVPMAEIERQFSEELNPYNSEKVEAREAKK